MASYPGAASSSFPIGAGESVSAADVPTFQVSSRWRRFFAGIIDFVIIFLPLAMVCLALIAPLFETETLPNGSIELTEASSQAIEDRVAFLVPLFALAPVVVFTLFTGLCRGQTLAKMMLGIRVVRVRDGKAPGIAVAAIRTGVSQIPQLLSTALVLVGFAVSGAIGWLFTLASLVIIAWILWDPYRQGLHDKVAKTVVIDTRSEQEQELEWRPKAGR